jgi:hypothetical protein
MLVIPLLSRMNDEYRNAVSQMGGRILMECPPDSMGFIPDSHWKGGGKARTGNIQHVIAVVMFENLAAQKEKSYDEIRLKRRLEAWLVSQRETRQPVGCPAELIPNDIRWWARTTQVDGDDASAKGGHGGARRICAEWNPVLGGLGYPPPTFRAVMRNMGATPADAQDVNSAIASIMRAGAMELWNVRNQVQQRLEIERCISALDKRDKVKAAEHRTANKTPTGRQKAARREAASVGKVHRDPLRDGLGVVIARYCVETDCTQQTESTGWFCPSCESRLPSRARKHWNPMAKVKLEKWESERRYCKARLTEKLREGGDGERGGLGWLTA